MVNAALTHSLDTPPNPLNSCAAARQRYHTDANTVPFDPDVKSPSSSADGLPPTAPPIKPRFEPPLHEQPLCGPALYGRGTSAQGEKPQSLKPGSDAPARQFMVSLLMAGNEHSLLSRSDHRATAHSGAWS